MFPLKEIKGTPKDDDDDNCLQDHDQQKRDDDDDDDDSPACQQSDPPPGEAPQGGQHHPATDRGHGEVLTRELPGDSRPQPDSPPKTSDSPWDDQEEWVDHTQGKRGGYYQEDQTQDRGHPPSRNDQVPEWRGYKRDPRRDQRYPDDPREAAGAYWIGPEDWADQRERYDLRYAGDAGYELSQGFDDRWNGQRTGAGHYDSHPRYDPAPPRQGIRPHFQQTAIRFPPQRQSQHWTTFTTTAPPPALSHPSATFHNSADCSRIVVHTSQPQGTEVTSQPQGTEVTSPNLGAPVLVSVAGVVSGRLTEESTKPHISLVYLTIIGSFITMFCCPCFGIPALVVSIQALSKSSRGWYHEARMNLWCSFALIIASGFVIMISIMPFIIPFFLSFFMILIGSG